MAAAAAIARYPARCGTVCSSSAIDLRGRRGADARNRRRSPLRPDARVARVHARAAWRSALTRCSTMDRDRGEAGTVARVGSRSGRSRSLRGYVYAWATIVAVLARARAPRCRRPRHYAGRIRDAMARLLACSACSGSTICPCLSHGYPISSVARPPFAQRARGATHRAAGRVGLCPLSLRVAATATTLPGAARSRSHARGC